MADVSRRGLFGGLLSRVRAVVEEPGGLVERTPAPEARAAASAVAPAVGRAPAPAVGRDPAPAVGRAPAPAVGRVSAPAVGRVSAPAVGRAPAPAVSRAPATAVAPAVGRAPAPALEPAVGRAPARAVAPAVAPAPSTPALPPAVANVIAWVHADARPARRGGSRTLLRPPGAVEEPAFLALCTRCGDCAPACPHGAITFASARIEGAAGTPIVDPSINACLLCEDRPCAVACGPQVLRADLPARMGTAMIQVFDCLAGSGSFCSTCVERCPVPGAMSLENGRPVVDVDACTGCGVCQAVCPAPNNAIRILPTRDRPEWTPPEVP